MSEPREVTREEAEILHKTLWASVKIVPDPKIERLEDLLRECLPWLAKFGMPTSAMDFNAIDDLIHRIRCVTAA